MRMKTLEEEQSKTEDDRLVKKANVSLPSEITEDILSRLPVKSILRFRSVSKPWLSRISDPSFAKLHFTRPHRTSLFFSAYDYSTSRRYLLSGPLEGGPLTHLMTLDNAYSIEDTDAQHLNGLVCYIGTKWLSRSDWAHDYAFVVNPSTHKTFMLPEHYTDVSVDGFVQYLFGFDESRNEHKVLMLRQLHEFEVMMFSLSNYAWRKIDVEPPVGFTWNDLRFDRNRNVCVNSVVHIMLDDSFDILAFDLRTEKFSIINPFEGVLPDDVVEYDPHLIKINGCLGVVCHDLVKTHIWILQDYENRIWVTETITLPKHRIEFHFPFYDFVDKDSLNMDEIIFYSSWLYGNVISLHVYNKKSRCFKSLQFTLGHQFPLPRSLEVEQIRCYVENMVPL